MLAPNTDPASLAGLELVDRNGERLGRVRQVYPDGGSIGWAGVRGNLIGTTEALVPLDDADLEDGVISVPVVRARFLSAPRRTPDAPMDSAEREQLRRFYADRPATSRAVGGAGADGAQPVRGREDPAPEQTGGADEAPVEAAAAEPVADDESTVAQPPLLDTVSTTPSTEESPAAPAAAVPDDEPDDADDVPAAAVPAPVAAPKGQPTGLTRSEQRIHVETPPVPTTRIVLRRVVVTEQKTITVPVRREELRLVRVPIVDADPVTDVRLEESEQELVLHEERVVVTTEVVPIERIRLVREVVSETREVTGETWREQLEAVEE